MRHERGRSGHDVRGCTFPWSRRATARALRGPPTTAGAQLTGTVLLVDDDAAVSRAAARMLESLGLVVLTAVDGLDAIERFRSEGHRVDVILMDLTMPRLGGVAAATAIHELRADVPIVVVSGYGDPTVESACVRRGPRQALRPRRVAANHPAARVLAAAHPRVTPREAVSAAPGAITRPAPTAQPPAGGGCPLARSVLRI